MSVSCAFRRADHAIPRHPQVRLRTKGHGVCFCCALCFSTDAAVTLVLALTPRMWYRQTWICGLFRGISESLLHLSELENESGRRWISLSLYGLLRSFVS
jgi:hypothetical protein